MYGIILSWAPLSNKCVELFSGSSSSYLRMTYDTFSDFDHLVSIDLLLRSLRPVALKEELFTYLFGALKVQSFTYWSLTICEYTKEKQNLDCLLSISIELLF